MMWSSTVLFTFLIAMSWMSDVEGCDCAQETNKDKFCRAKFVLQGKIHRIINAGLKVKYEVEVLYSFRFKENHNVIIESSSDSAMCGQLLTKGTIYLLSGTKNSYGRYETDNCWWNQYWADVPHDIQTKLMSRKYANCYLLEDKEQ